ncbi:hypothetical protein ACOJTA_06490 [Malaciobacter sp. WC5094]
MKKELFIFLTILILLSISFHFEEWITYPLLHLKNLSQAGALGFGSFHPLIFSFFIYLFLLIPRAFILFITKKILKKQ